MEEESRVAPPIVETVVSDDGVQLTIMASRLGPENWELSIQNEHEINTTWHECYPSAKLAIEAGRKAIDDKGVESFVDAEGFEYLFNENV